MKRAIVIVLVCSAAGCGSTPLSGQDAAPKHTDAGTRRIEILGTVIPDAGEVMRTWTGPGTGLDPTGPTPKK